LIIDKVIEKFSPSMLIFVGSAFGCHDTQVSPGDILVSEQLLEYELQRVPGDQGDQVEIIVRNDRPHASSQLLRLLRNGIPGWQGQKVRFGTILSGERPVQVQQFREHLQRVAPEALGGEMRGAGLYSVAQLKNVDWVVVKSVCDWVDGTRGRNESASESLATKNAISFILHSLQQNKSSAIKEHSTEIELALTVGKKLPIGTMVSTYNGHTSYVVALDWQPQGSYIASAGGDGTIQVWRADTGQLVQTYRGHPWRFARVNWPPTIYTVVWSPEGLRLASAGDRKNIFVWNATTGQTLGVYEEHFGVMNHIFAAAWSPDGKHIASACSSATWDKTVHVWDAGTRETVKRLNANYNGCDPNFSISNVAWSPDGKRIAAICGKKAIRLWESESGQLLSTYRINAGYVYRLVWSPDGTRIAIACENHRAQIWDVAAGRAILTYYGHTDRVRYLAWSPDGTRMVTASNDTTAQVWNAGNGDHIYTYKGHSRWVTAVVWSPDGTRIASASNDRTVQIWDAGGPC